MTAKTVWKYTLVITDEPQELLLPLSAQINLVAMQYGQLCLWFEVDPEEPKFPRRYVVHGTGHPIAESSLHVGSAVAAGGALVWHVYEAGRGGSRSGQ